MLAGLAGSLVLKTGLELLGFCFFVFASVSLSVSVLALAAAFFSFLFLGGVGAVAAAVADVVVVAAGLVVAGNDPVLDCLCHWSNGC